MEAPSDLVTFDQTHHSFRVSWTGPDSPPEKFLLAYARTAGGDAQEVKDQGRGRGRMLRPFTGSSQRFLSVVNL